jgi:hypothetical protein
VGRTHVRARHVQYLYLLLDQVSGMYVQHVCTGSYQIVSLFGKQLHPSADNEPSQQGSHLNGTLHNRSGGCTSPCITRTQARQSCAHQLVQAAVTPVHSLDKPVGRVTPEQVARCRRSEMRARHAVRHTERRPNLRQSCAPRSAQAYNRIISTSAKVSRHHSPWAGQLFGAEGRDNGCRLACSGM